MDESIKTEVRREGPLTDAAFVAALCVWDLSRQGKPPGERETVRPQAVMTSDPVKRLLTDVANTGAGVLLSPG